MNVKSLEDISWKVNEEEYRSDPAYSYSTIAKFNREGFKNLNKLFDKVETSSLVFGSMVDTLLTDGLEEFNRKFEIAQFSSIPDSVIRVVKDIFREFHLTHRRLEDIPDSEILIRANSFNYQNNWKAETKIKSIREKGSDYYKLLYLSENKILVSNKDYQDAQDCVNVLKNHRYTKWYFEPNNPFNRTIERFYQLKFKGEWENIPLRCMADLIIVDHERKVIIPCDLKTSSKKEWEFHRSFIEWGYWIQAQLYWFIINQNLKKDEIFKDYKLLDYRFIVISNESKKPLIWEYPDTQVVTDCTYGTHNQYLCRNWRNIVKELDYYLTHTSEYPIGISNTNDIKHWLNQE